MKTPAVLQHQNRKGQVYYIQEGKTPSGKPKYYAGRKLTGKPLAELPDDYEIHEKPDTAQVVVRKVKPSPITEFERKMAEEIVRRDSGLDHFIVAIEDDALVVYTPSVSRAETDRLIDRLAGPIFGKASGKADAFRENSIKHSPFVKMLRFELNDPHEHSYRASRWCFLGSIDHWIMLHGSGTLAELVEQFAKHLDQESFFELM